MNIELIAFTNRGCQLGERLEAVLNQRGNRARFSSGRQPGFVKQWTEKAFATADALVFIGAAGIAVRSIAPFLKDKTTDPAVVVVEDSGSFIISLLSGHLGGANLLVCQLAEITGATPVITTATDTHGVFAVDSWAVSRGFRVVNPEYIVEISAALLDGKQVGVTSSFPISEPLPAGITKETLLPMFEISEKSGITGHLQLVPPVLTVGIGCRKGTTSSAILTQYLLLLEQAKVHPLGVKQICSIDLKKEEPGLLEFCSSQGLPLVTFSAEELGAVSGEYTSSAFVKEITGVDNVCERSAVLGSGGRLLSRKISGNGVTVALGTEPLMVSFGDPRET